MEGILNKLKETVSYIRAKSSIVPCCGMILGSGLGGVAENMEVEVAIPYEEIPNFPVSTVEGHRGQLMLGEWNGKKVVVMKGRFHYYEGYSLQQVTFPIRVMKSLGGKTLIITNASGGLNPEIKIGELMVVTDHINLNSDNPLRGLNEDQLGPRFPDQHALYDRELIDHALKSAAAHNIACHKGVYVGVTGPNFETPAEYRYMRIIGGDVVGMSTVPEVIVANHAGMRVFCISVICDEGNPDVPAAISHDEVVRAAAEAKPRMGLILKEVLQYA
jgi:purine-nucleoside phosphorylase